VESNLLPVFTSSSISFISNFCTSSVSPLYFEEVAALVDHLPARNMQEQTLLHFYTISSSQSTSQYTMFHPLFLFNASHYNQHPICIFHWNIAFSIQPLGVCLSFIASTYNQIFLPLHYFYCIHKYVWVYTRLPLLHFMTSFWGHFEFLITFLSVFTVVEFRIA